MPSKRKESSTESDTGSSTSDSSSSEDSSRHRRRPRSRRNHHSSKSSSEVDHRKRRRDRDIEKGRHHRHEQLRHGKRRATGGSSSSDDDSSSEDDRRGLIHHRHSDRGSGNKIIWIVVVIVILALLGVGGYYIYTHYSSPTTTAPGSTSGATGVAATGGAGSTSPLASTGAGGSGSGNGGSSGTEAAPGGGSTNTDFGTATDGGTGGATDTLSPTELSGDATTTGSALDGTSSVVATRTSGGSHTGTATGTASGTKGTKSSTGTGTKTGLSTSSRSSTGTAPASTSTGSSGAPYFVIYSFLGAIPAAADLKGFNVMMLAFWTHTDGALYSAKSWSKANKAAYTAAGIKVMVSAFGGGINPTTDGADPKDVATKLAKFVTDSSLDGVDVDYEDKDAYTKKTAAAWLQTLTTELRTLLPSPQYLISHAPEGPYFGTLDGGPYMQVHKSVGGKIDFYNVQFYNQGDYKTCDTLFNKAPNQPGTAVLELVAAGIPGSKVVLGKPAESGDAGDGQVPTVCVLRQDQVIMCLNRYMTPDAIKPCIAAGRTKNWNGGLMWWQYHADNAKTLVSSTWGT